MGDVSLSLVASNASTRWYGVLASTDTGALHSASDLRRVRIFADHERPNGSKVLTRVDAVLLSLNPKRSKPQGALRKWELVQLDE